MKERDRLASLGEMAAGLAHEIRNPLGAIKASAQFLAEPSASGEAGHHEPTGLEFLNIIVEEVDRLNRVVSSFLDYARPSQLGDANPIDVNATVRRTVQLLGPQFGAGIEPSVDLESDLPRVRIDAERLRQVVINLALNAVQAMEGQGRVDVRTRSVQRDAQSWVEVHVADTGPGIPPRVLKNLFVPFVTTKDRGTGLGLAISQRIVNAAGGHIEARSSAGIGTTFVVRLPAVDEAAVAEEERASSAPPQGTASAAAPLRSTPESPSASSSPPGPESLEGAPDAALPGAGDRASSLASNR
jgi:signal transduction histidine kinase